MNKSQIIIMFLIGLSFNFCGKVDNPLTVKDKNNDTNIKFNGRIIDSVSFPIYGIQETKIKVISNTYSDSTFSDSLGYFDFSEIPKDNYNVIVSHKDYNSLVEPIEFNNEDSLYKIYELNFSNKYSQGQILAGFIDTTSTLSIFNLTDSLDLRIEKLIGFVYKSEMDKDSLGFIKNILSSKPYLDGINDNTVYIFNDEIIIICNFIKLDKNIIEDWIYTRNQIKLVNKNIGFKNGIINVPDYEEKKWARELRNYKIFRWITLDYFIPIDLY